MSRASQFLLAASALIACAPVSAATVESVKAAIAKVDATIEVKDCRLRP